MATAAARTEPDVVGVDERGTLPLPWLTDAMAQARALRRSQALLVVGPAGVGHLEFAFVLAQSWLCEDPGAAPCGRCTSCHLVRRRAHPDLLTVLPDALRQKLGWPADDEPRVGRADAKPSRDLRVGQVREAIDWSHRTSGRGRGKALLFHPADALNVPAANALLKTLEEPAPGLHLLLTSIDPELLLPTLRSRCQRLRLALPGPELAMPWLRERGLTTPDALLAFAAGSPIEALAWAAEGLTPALLAELPKRVAAGDASAMVGWPLPRAIDALHKLAHDAQARAAGGAARFFAAATVPPATDMAALVAWQRALLQAARHEEHPWNAPLLVESLVAQAAKVWSARSTVSPALR